MLNVKSANFIGSFDKIKDVPQSSLPIIGLFGRSNAGKSSLVNKVTQRKKIAIAGRTPGTTKKINIYELDLLDSGTAKSLRIFDFPGFGYGKFSKSIRKSVSKEIVAFIDLQPPPSLVCLLNDSLRDPEEDEMAIIEYCEEVEVELLLIITKVDRLTQSQKHLRMKSFKSLVSHTVRLVESGRDTKGEVLLSKMLSSIFT